MFTADLRAKINLKGNGKKKIGVVNTNIWKIITHKFILSKFILFHKRIFFGVKTTMKAE